MLFAIRHEHRVIRGAEIRRYAEVGQCIYCFRKPPDVVLSDEHIIADGVRGNLLLPKSSCIDCARITGRVEQQVLRGMLEQPRGALGLWSRKRRPRKLAMPMRIRAEHGPEEERLVPHEGMPPLLITFVDDKPPGILIGSPPDREWAGHVTVIMPGDATERARAAIGECVVKWGFRFHAGVFSQAIAKTAHAYAVAELGLNGFKPFLNEYCISHEPSFDSHHISSMTDVSNDPALHYISIGTAFARSFTAVGVSVFPVYVVRFRLFSELSAPSFFVVVGSPL